MNFLYVIIILFISLSAGEVPVSESTEENTNQETLHEQINTENTIQATTAEESSYAKASSYVETSADRPADETDDKQKEKTIIPPLIIPMQPGNESIVPLEPHAPQFSEITVPVVSEESSYAKASSDAKASSSLLRQGSGAQAVETSADEMADKSADNEHEKDKIENLEQPEVPTELEHVEEIIPEEPDAQVGIDTSSLEEPQGNWLFKRMWWDRSQEAYQKIKNLIDSIMDKRVNFFTKRANLDKELFDAFYLEIGMGLGEFTTLIEELTSELEKERIPEELSEEKQKILDNLTIEKTSIDQVKKHIELIKRIDHAIEQSLSTVIEIINSVRKYEHDAWQYFKEISEILSEKKARELFYKIDVALQNVKQMNNYLDQGFAAYFENLEARARTSVEQIRKDLQSFKDKGIDLKTSITRLQQEEVKIIEEQRQEEEEEIKPKKPVSWWQSIINLPSSVINKIKSYF